MLNSTRLGETPCENYIYAIVEQFSDLVVIRGNKYLKKKKICLNSPQVLQAMCEKGLPCSFLNQAANFLHVHQI